MKRAAAWISASALLAACCVPAARADRHGVERPPGRAKGGEESPRRASEERARQDDESPYGLPFVGNKESRKAHRRECEWAGKIAPPNRVHFKTFEDAAAAGYMACKVCTPDRGPVAPYVGNMVTRKVHRASCDWAAKIRPGIRRGFATWKEAEGAGYVACGRCKPEMRGVPEPPPGAASPPPAVSSPPPPAAAGAFIGHRLSRKVHRAGCAWGRKILEKNRVYFDSYAEAAAAGYAPCKACGPDEGPAPPAGARP